jgi:hypothetical protein
VLVERGEWARQTRGWQAAPHLSPVAGVVCILAEPERRVGREREERCQPHPQVVHHPERGLPVGEANVDVEAERQLLADEAPVVLQQLLVQVVRGYSLLLPA